MKRDNYISVMKALVDMNATFVFTRIRINTCLHTYILANTRIH